MNKTTTKIDVKPAAIGMRVHSGWAAVVAVSGDLHSPEILERRRIAVVNSTGPRANQPYHFAKDLPLDAAEAHLAECARTATLLATKGMQTMLDGLRAARYDIEGCSILTASGRPLPDLARVLASHPMIHTAEGEFFRNVFAGACKQLGIRVTKIRERDLLEQGAKELRVNTPKLTALLTTLGRDLGAPWTQDQKSAALAALLLLNSHAKARA